MFKRTLGGLAVVLGVAGVANAQYNPGRPAFAPIQGRPAAQSQVQSSNVQAVKADGVMAMPASTQPVVMSPAAHVPSSNLEPSSSCARDVAESCGDTGCNTGCCNALCGPPGRFWVGAEWLFWTTKGNKYPPLLTTAPVGTPQAVAGTIGDPRTSTLVGGDDNRYNDNWRSGFRLYGGLWLNQNNTFGVEGDFFFLGKSTQDLNYASNGSQILTRPFTNNVLLNGLNFTTTNPFADTQLVSFPNVVSGSIAIHSESEFLGAGVNLIKNICCNPCGRLDLLVGYRYLRLRDYLTIDEDLTGLAGSDFPGVRFQVHDEFRTLNQFNGVNIGFAAERRFGSFFVGLRSTVALGVTHTTVDIDGYTIITDPATGATREVGGLLAQPSNIGHYEERTFAVVPEIGLKAGVQVTDHLRVFAGYNFIYWSKVIRPGDVIDTRVNASQIPPRDPAGTVGPLYPRYEPKYSSFFAHGVSVGLELRY